MSEPQSPEPSEPGVEEATAVPLLKPTVRQRYVRLPKRRSVRWVLGSAVVVVLGVAAVGTGVALERHHDGRSGPVMVGRAFGPDGEVTIAEGPGGKVVRRGPDGSVQVFPGGGKVPALPELPGPVDGFGEKSGGKSSAKLAPAPLPGVAADQALAKATAAVPGGKAAGLSVIGREGGGSSWAVEVLGADGVRHLVTVDGTDGSITGNTVADGR
ncbi:PepSY domain-containing protein [Streptomyces sp. TLI_171]|uniref:PepSY domain-containing protein n=1 Tax=Streptomyces sp. TLI_171 TaxID=1938859 RepID=UPI000C18BCF6|nr:PepSY domain-containing protein [Streptomyces sp. TLI_171]RKE20142.1 hypothetical protein BX266_3490 [Streptomyces sp. TLI_171]